jgi:hypothetical protein
VIVKCDSALVDFLRQRYTGVGHRSHLDRRYEISNELDADVLIAETKKLIGGSYDRIHENLTRKQKKEVAAQLQPRQDRREPCFCARRRLRLSCLAGRKSKRHGEHPIEMDGVGDD